MSKYYSIFVDSKSELLLESSWLINIDVKFLLNESLKSEKVTKQYQRDLKILKAWNSLNSKRKFTVVDLWTEDSDCII